MRSILAVLMVIFWGTSTQALPLVDSFDNLLTHQAGKPLVKDLGTGLKLLKYANLAVGGLTTLGFAYDGYGVRGDQSSLYQKVCIAASLVAMVTHTWAHHVLIDSLVTGRMPNKLLASLPFSLHVRANPAAGFTHTNPDPDSAFNNLFAPDGLEFSGTYFGWDVVRTAVNYLYLSEIENKFTPHKTSSWGFLAFKWLHTGASCVYQIMLLAEFNRARGQEYNPSLSYMGATFSSMLGSFIKNRVHAAAI